MPAVQRHGHGDGEMTEPAAPDPEPEPAGAADQPSAASEQVVPMLRVRCNKCRRARAQYLANQRKGGAGLPRLGRPVPVCPHYETVWAPGFGPDSEPPPDSGWETRPDGPV